MVQYAFCRARLDSANLSNWVQVFLHMTKSARFCGQKKPHGLITSDFLSLLREITSSCGYRPYRKSLMNCFLSWSTCIVSSCRRALHVSNCALPLRHETGAAFTLCPKRGRHFPPEKSTTLKKWFVNLYIYKTECRFVCIFCMQIYSFTPILMKFCTLDLQNNKKITVYFNFTKNNPYYHFQPC
jgi:hypothetical protein